MMAKIVKRGLRKRRNREKRERSAPRARGDASSLDQPEETAKVLKVHDDGRLWSTYRDIGTMDEDGFFYS